MLKVKLACVIPDARGAFPSFYSAGLRVAQHNCYLAVVGRKSPYEKVGFSTVLGVEDVVRVSEDVDQVGVRWPRIDYTPKTSPPAS